MTPNPDQLSTPETASFWAKTGDKDSPTRGLSLVQHMLDAGSVAARLWDTWLAPGLQKRFSEHLHLSMEDTRALVCWLAATHDMGKATPEFSGQLDARRDENLAVYRQRIEQQDFEFPEDLVTPTSGLRCPHSKYSQSILIHLLTSSNIEGMPREVAETLASISGAHHGTPADYMPNSVDLSNVILERLSPKWHATWQELYDITLEHFGASSALQQLAQNKQSIPVSVQFCITGFVIMSDWIASNPDFFPMGTFGSAEQEQRARIGWQALGLEQRWIAALDTNPDTPAADLYASRFGWDNPTLRPMQEVVVEAARSMQSGGMMCIEAPMGQGKTEAGLIAAEFLAQATGRTGVAFAAPTQATSNALFDRVIEWVKYQTNNVAQEHGEPIEPHSMFLGHSKNRFNKSYEALSKADIFDEPSASVRDHNRKTLRPGTSLARHSWLSGTKRGLLSSFVVCTIDQVLMTALQARHVMLRYLGLASKVIIIDEVHAYDAYMSKYLSAALYWMGQMNAPVILMSATLPSATRDDLMKSYAKGLKIGAEPDKVAAPAPPSQNDLMAKMKARLAGIQAAPKPEASEEPFLDLDYPVVHTLTAEDNGTPKKWKVEQPVEQTEIELKLIADSPECVLNVLEPLANDHGCAAVICNTVGRAQEMHAFLSERFGEEHVVLTHSRFTATHRAEQEELLVSKLGKKAHYSEADGEDSSRPHRLIVVGTQVIEQSLDLDFDVMITDFAPVDLVLQRMGRLHRHDSRSNSERTPAYRKPVCYVRGIETFGSHDEAPDFPRGSKAVYEPMILFSSYAQLLPHFDGEPIRIPADISPLVQKTYQENTSTEIPSAWAEVFESAKQEYKRGQTDAKRRAEGYLLRAPLPTHETMADCMKRFLKADDQRFSDEQIGEAKVRDTDSSLEVIAIVVERNDPGNPRSAIKSYRLLPSINGTDESDSLGFDASADEPPNYWQSMQLVASSIRLPYQYSDAPKNRLKGGKLRFDDALDQLEKERIENWQKSFMLEGQLILPFEEVEAGVYSYELCDYELVYTTQLGLQSIKLDNED